MPTPGTLRSHHARLGHFLIQDAQVTGNLFMALLARLCQARHSKIEYVPLSSSAIERARFARKNDSLVAPYPRNLAL
jgi:hypothetical protein